MQKQASNAFFSHICKSVGVVSIFFVAAANYKSNQIVLQGKGQEQFLAKVAATSITMYTI